VIKMGKFFDMLDNEECAKIIKPCESEKVEEVLQEIETESHNNSGLIETE
jgi:hypothetical protein